MKLPDPVPVSDAALAAIVERHGPRSASLEALPTVGIINTVYALGNDLILRVPRNHPAHVAHAYREAAAIPQAIAAGVRTPTLIAFDAARDILPVPYSIVERVPGVNRESLDLDPQHDPDVWRALGRDLARLHAIARPDQPRRSRRRTSVPIRASSSSSGSNTAGFRRSKRTGFSAGWSALRRSRPVRCPSALSTPTCRCPTSSSIRPRVATSP